MKLSFVIPAHNEERYLGACLASVLTQTEKYPGEYEILVVNNASTDNTKTLALSFPGVRVVDEPSKGLTKARQRGLTESRGELLACIDADTRVPDGWLPLCLEKFAADKSLVCFSGPFRYYDLPRNESRIVTFWNWCLNKIAAMNGSLVQGGNFVAKRQALLDIGGFDTSIAFYGEDTNIARRLAKVGKVRFDKHFFIFSSARRLQSEGLANTGLKYLANYLSEIFFKKPVTKTYRDIR